MAPRFDIKGDIGVGKACADALGEFLRTHPEPVFLHINSGGGDAAEGAALMAEVERHGKVTAVVQGIAASAATLPVVGAQTIIMHPAATFMIHEPWVMAGGTGDGHRAIADTLDKMTLTYARAYARSTGHSVNRIAAWMKQETWLTAEEALELNFCDQIEVPSGAPKMVAAFDYSKFRAAPAELLRLTAQNGWANASTNQNEMEKQNA